MTPLLVFVTFIFGIIFANTKKTDRKLNSFDIDEEGLKEVFPDLNKNRKVCRYYFSGDLDSPKICENEFECKDCPVHKKFANLFFFIKESCFCVKRVENLYFSPCLFYHRGHTVVTIGKNGNVFIGIDSFLLNLLGKRAEKIALPDIGDFIEANEIGFSIIVNNEYFPVLSPVSGEVIRVNENIVEDFTSNRCFVWLCAVKPFSLEADLQSLLFGKESEEWMKYELKALRTMLFKGSKFAADGGNIDFIHIKFNMEEFIENFLLSYKKIQD